MIRTGIGLLYSQDQIQKKKLTHGDTRQKISMSEQLNLKKKNLQYIKPQKKNNLASVKIPTATIFRHYSTNLGLLSHPTNVIAAINSSSFFILNITIGVCKTSLLSAAFHFKNIFTRAIAQEPRLGLSPWKRKCTSASVNFLWRKSYFLCFWRYVL